MPKKMIEKVVVLGAGTMGARIAAHVANAGVWCALLDIAPKELSAEEQKRGLTLASPDVRNRIVRAGLAAAVKSKPAAFFKRGVENRIVTGNYEDDLKLCAEADWIIEVVAENLEIKRALLSRLAAVRKPGTIVTTNTSGLPVHSIAEGMPEEWQQHWAGTHFFNPPRYLKLVEIIPGTATLSGVIETLADFCDHKLGKGVVVAKDTPNFIANRIGTFSMLNAIHLMGELGMTFEEVDACTGPALGWPKSATFRLADIVGIDVLLHVIRNIYENIPNDESRELYKVPALIEEMAKRGWIGDKTGSGFYKRVKKAGGESEILTLDPAKMEYRPQQKARFASIEAGKAIESTRDRLRMLCGPALEGKVGDKAQKFIWGVLSGMCLYAARRVPEISDSIADVDRAMRWGFGWELGPFEIWDAIGVEAMARQLEKEGKAKPPLVSGLLTSAKKSFYESAKGETSYFDFAGKAYKPVPQADGIIILKSLKERGREIEKNSGASLIDLGDGVICCEFHSKMNAIGGDLLGMIHKGLARLRADFDAMVIANQAENFSAGANLMLVLMTAQEQEWDDLHVMVRQFQNTTLAIKHSPKPVVVAPQGLALGGGCEVVLHGTRVHAAAEAYMGLVEVGVGLIPAGGGSKEMIIRANERAEGEEDLDLFHALKPVFENIAMARVSTSGEEARDLGYLRRADLVAMNLERLVADAKETALGLVRSEWRQTAPSPNEPSIRVLGQEFSAAAKLAVYMMLKGEYISEYDAIVARKLGHILAGGALTSAQLVSEQYLLDLEREAFVSLCGERKTQERIAHTLKTGKPLRN
ncbi:MAG TPA: 3-hydroxyacyl-CoA dehydrogenase NAD-binding domain-containing protein [Candidatus Saccharimonadales bacterium]|nr:3-hydroxyacyl-CoA dehydrogenase NAD-binding domain-containing protein [Candidatus Saccharimonadales bacterium]